MILDINYFGYGCGLVMMGWVCGMIFSLAIGIVNAFKRG